MKYPAAPEEGVLIDPPTIEHLLALTTRLNMAAIGTLQIILTQAYMAHVPLRIGPPDGVPSLRRWRIVRGLAKALDAGWTAARIRDAVVWIVGDNAAQGFTLGALLGSLDQAEASEFETLIDVTLAETAA